MEEKRKRTSRDTDWAGTRAGSEQTHRQPGSAQREGAYRYRNPEEEGYYGNGQGQQQYRQGQGGYYQNGSQQGYYQNGPQQGYYQNDPQQGYYQNDGQSYYQSQGNPNMYQGQGYYQEPDQRNRSHKKKKKKHRKLIFALEPEEMDLVGDYNNLQYYWRKHFQPLADMPASSKKE